MCPDQAPGGSQFTPRLVQRRTTLIQARTRASTRGDLIVDPQVERVYTTFLPKTRGTRRRRFRRGFAATALTTASSILLTFLSGTPALADEPGDNPTNPWERTLRISLGVTARQDRCVAARFIHLGGPEAKALAGRSLAGTDADVATAIGHRGWLLSGPLGQALDRDKAAADTAIDTFQARQLKLDASNSPYRSVNYQGGRDFHAPAFGAGILGFAGHTLWGKITDDPRPMPGKASLDKARTVLEGISTPDDYWETSYRAVASDELLGIRGGSGASANDVAQFLRYGGFPKQAPAPDSLEFRTEAEALKIAWANCDSANPIDYNRALTGPVVQAFTEWEAEYAGQAKQRADIMAAELEAAKQTRVATTAMIEAIRQAWLADQILYWQKYWSTNTDGKPGAAVFTKATADLGAARNTATAQVAIADKAAAAAAAASGKAATAQTSAWAVADAAKTPRGRGLLYAQQSVQVAKASSAAALAAAKTTATAANAAKATAANSGALYALSKTQAHALNTEFRRAAAQEAAAQAKSAMQAAEAQAKEAAANATKAKHAQATAESAERTAKEGAAEAKRQRGIAEAEKANATRERENAGREREKAAVAEQRAQAEREAAQQARASAEASATDAAAQREAAEAAEGRAALARSTAETAERNRNAKASRAAALEAAAAAAEGTDSAGEAREAAGAARAAANEASDAAVRARTAAGEASTASVNARAAATRSTAAASRSRAAADKAWSAYQTTHAAAATAHAAAAEAIDAAANAKANARAAEAEAKKAQAAAIKARQEATAAQVEAAKTAAWAAKTAGFSYAAGQAAAGARDAARVVNAAAEEAIALGSPYRETDVSAAFAVLVGQAAKPLAEQQAAAAQASAKEAAKAAATAKALADQAAGNAKIAAQAAAAAAADAAKALEHVAAARTSAAEAEKAAAAAKRADARAQEYDVQAGVDAMHASFAATDATSEATAADQEATAAERDAASARSAATTAEQDAGSARIAATQAEGDATAAEGAATRAHESATEADKAADRAEAAEREEEQRAIKERVEANGSDVGPELTLDEEELLRRECGEECVSAFRAAKALAGQGVLDWVKENGGEILLEEIGYRDLERCFTEGDIESCLWTLAKAIPVAKAWSVGKAIVRVAGGIGGFLEKSVTAKRTLDKFRKIIDDAKQGKGRACPVKPKPLAARAAAFAAPTGVTTALSAAASSEYPGVGTIVSEGGVTVQIYSNDHAPPHAHVKGKGKEVRVGQNGRPLAGDPELSRLQKAVIDSNIRTIRENIRVAMERFKANGGC
ncbi:hypothetical protein AB0E66_05260 [Streptomyces sp. NPDC033753]|uniref:hypothetical protein n=1 Tax=Streptomyces sp. NPDC033753 TaxID=3155128 RepID=UPI0034018EC8